jgi:hypothetical protein
VSGNKYVLATAHNKGFPKHIIQEMKNKKHPKTNNMIHRQQLKSQAKTWITFTFHSPAIYKATNLLKSTNLKIVFRATNTIIQKLSQKPKNNDPPGIYSINCNTYKKAYVGQRGRSI